MEVTHTLWNSSYSKKKTKKHDNNVHDRKYDIKVKMTNFDRCQKCYTGFWQVTLSHVQCQRSIYPSPVAQGK